MFALSSSIRTVVLLGGYLLLAGCSTAYLANRPANDLYCDNFVLYEMCARDSNRDGIVDYTYFQESKEIFMYRDRLPRRIPAGFGVHRCAMPKPTGISRGRRSRYMNISLDRKSVV